MDKMAIARRKYARGAVLTLLFGNPRAAVMQRTLEYALTQDDSQAAHLAAEVRAAGRTISETHSDENTGLDLAESGILRSRPAPRDNLSRSTKERPHSKTLCRRMKLHYHNCTDILYLHSQTVPEGELRFF